MAGLAGLEPATFCLEDRRSDSAELQAPNESPKSQVQYPKSECSFFRLDIRPETLNFHIWSGREADTPLQTPRSQAVAVLLG